MKLVPVRLRDLGDGEEFWTLLTGRHGIVEGRGHVLLTGTDGVRRKARAVLVYLDLVPRVMDAETRVGVPADRPHACWPKPTDHLRWRKLLPAEQPELVR